MIKGRKKKKESYEVIRKLFFLLKYLLIDLLKEFFFKFNLLSKTISILDI